MGKTYYKDGTIRLPSTYHQPGFYFITICVKNRDHAFGQCKNGVMCLSELGQVAYQNWQRIPEFHPYVNIHEFIIMPDHMHGIVEIVVGAQHLARTNKNPQSVNGHHDQMGGDDYYKECAQGVARLRNKFGPQSNNIASIIRGYKSAVKKYATMNKLEFAWQPRYWDHVIRNEYELARIKQYILDNPKKWKS